MSQNQALRIEGELTIYRAAELCDALKAALAAAPAGADFEVDLSAVTEMDGAGVQLLLATRKTTQAAGRALRLVAASPAVTEVLETLQLSAHFDDATSEAC